MNTNVNMKTFSDSLQIIEDEKEFADLKAIIKKKIGFNCDEYKEAHLKRRLAARLRANKSISYKEYSKILLSDEEETSKLKEGLTVNVTELFRNPETYEAFRFFALPELIKTKGYNRTIKIWSAGCSNGEEPYSIAIMLVEYLGTSAKRYKISILGTDIDDDSLAKAKRANYKLKQVEKMDKRRLDQFFIKNNESYNLAEDLHRMVQFKHHDMISGPAMYGFDIIFCRNVTIYFEQKLQEKLYLKFYDSLNNGGYFVMGKTETLVGPACDLFEPVNLKERIYRKIR
jgi:chemotaxis protein methyltransferase CheR